MAIQSTPSRRKGVRRSYRLWGDEPRGNERSSEAPVRLAVLFAGNGFHRKEWWAKGEGKRMQLGKVLEPPWRAPRVRHAFVR